MIHIVIPDTQQRPGVRSDHMSWAGRFIVDKFATKYLAEEVTIIHLGDHWDMPSLSSYDKGTGAMEGRRVRKDIEAGNRAFDLLNEPLKAFNAGRRKKWYPRCHFLLGNHEDRITKAVKQDARLEGLVSLEDLNAAKWGWEVHPFLKPVKLGGIYYCHYFYHPMTGRAYGGSSIDARLKTIGCSFTMGHQQERMYGCRQAASGEHHGLVAGAFYLHDEGYKGPQGNNHWRGLVVKHQVENGRYDPMFVGIEWLCRKYTGKTLAQFLR